MQERTKMKNKQDRSDVDERPQALCASERVLLLAQPRARSHRLAAFVEFPARQLSELLELLLELHVVRVEVLALDVMRTTSLSGRISISYRSSQSPLR